MKRQIRILITHISIALAALSSGGAARADWQVIDQTAIDKLSDILGSIGNRSGGSGDNSNLNDTTSKLLKEIQTQVQRASFSASLGTSNLQKIGDTSGYVQTACGGAIAPITSQPITSLATINPATPSASKQQICQQIIQLRAQSFNEGVDMAGRFQQYSQQLDAIAQKRDSAQSQGDLWANTNEALRTIGMLQAEMSLWQTRAATFDKAIKYLEGQQNAITQSAVKGGRGSIGLGQMIQTGVLAAALAIR